MTAQATVGNIASPAETNAISPGPRQQEPNLWRTPLAATGTDPEQNQLQNVTLLNSACERIAGSAVVG